MHFIAGRLFLLFALGATLVSAAPGGNNRNRASQLGAVYFITNDPSGNFVVSSLIQGDGTLALGAAIQTFGFGAHGAGESGPDPLFSQGAVKASPAAKMLAAVNPGSNTVSIFSINPQDLRMLSPVGFPVSSGGEFPMSLAFSKDGKRLCVLNSGQVNGVKCFRVDQKLGLIPLPNTERSLKLDQTSPATGPANTASHVIFSEDGTQLLATVKGDPTNATQRPGFIAAWDIQQDGSLSPDFKTVPLPSGGLLPFSMTVVPGKNAILATDANVGFDLFNTQGGITAGSQGARQNSANPIAGQGATCWSSFSPKTQNLYLTDIKKPFVTEVSVDNNLKGQIVKQHPLPAGSSSIDNEVATVNGKDILYILSPGRTSIDILALNGPGSVQNLGSLDFSGPAKQIGLALDGNNIQGLTSFVL
jgi:hypothetical protein